MSTFITTTTRPALNVPTAAAAAIITAGIEDNKVRRRAFRDRDHAKRTAPCTIAGRPDHLVDIIFCGINGARETITAAIGTVNLDTPGWHLIAERRCRFKVNGVPSKLDKGLTRRINVGSSNVRRPVAHRVRLSTPNTGFLGPNARRVNVIMRCCAAPVLRVRHRKGSVVADQGGNQHGLVSWEHSLAERDMITGVVYHPYIRGRRLTVRLVREGFLDIAIVIAIQPTILSRGEYWRLQAGLRGANH